MKKLFYFLFVELVIVSQCLAVPSNSMSISPSATNGTTITATDENSRNNEISSKFNAHSHTDITSLGTVTTGTWNATSIASQYVDDFNPQTISSAAVITEGAGTITDVTFGSSTTITATIDGKQTVLIIARITWKNNDATGGVTFKITDSNNNAIDALTDAASLDAATANEQYSTTIMVIDTRPTSGTKAYKIRFQRVTAGTVSLVERNLIVLTLPDPA